MCNDWCLQLGNDLKKYINKKTKVLEVGARNVNGTVRGELQQYSGEWTGIDIMDGPGVDLLLDVTRITEYFPPQSFDVVISTEMLEHCRDWRKAILEMVRVLRPGGTLLLTTRSPGFEPHDYPADYWRFSPADMNGIFSPAGEILLLKDDMTLGFPCGIGIIIRKSTTYDDDAFRKHLEQLHPTAMEGVSELQIDMENVILFDQHSRLKACSELLAAVANPGETVLDVGCGPECLLGRFIPQLRITYVDPLIKDLPFRSAHQIVGTLDSPELEGKKFDHIVAIDVLEHIPPELRPGFIRKLTAFARKNVLLAFPSADQTDASKVDEVTNIFYKKAFDQDYPWLHEHFACGLPSICDTESHFDALKWHTKTFFHGNALLLCKYLPRMLVLWESEITKRCAYELSRTFTEMMSEMDKCPPFYRAYLLASVEPITEPAGLFTAECTRFEERSQNFSDDVFLTVYKEVIATTVAKTDFERERSAHEACQRELETCRQELHRWRTLPHSYKILRGYEILRQGPLPFAKAVVKKILPKSVVAELKNFKKRKVFSELRSVLQNNNSRLIIAYSIIPWNLRWQRPQQLLSRLAGKGWTIIYISATLTPHGSVYANQNFAFIDVGVNQLHNNVYEICLSSETPYCLYDTNLDGGNLRNAFMGISAILAELKVTNPLQLVQFPSWHQLAKQVRQRFGGRLVFDCMDDHSGFKNTTSEALCVECDLMRDSDLVLASSNLLLERARTLNPQVLLVNNGTEFDHFHAPKRNGELDFLASQPIIGYYGAIAEWFDVDLIVQCAKAKPEWNFVLIGSTTGCDTSSFEQLQNIHLLGEKPYTELPGYLAYFTVCTIPFKREPLTLATNPVKFYEYLSCAKPVVATSLPELEQFSDISYLAKDAKDFLKKLALAVTEIPDENLTNKRLEVARANSWDTRVKTILSSPAFKMNASGGR